MSESGEQVTMHDFKNILNGWFRYLLSKWLIILVVGAVFGVCGILYAWYQKPLYTAELTFASENTSASRLSGYAGLAAQFGVDLSSGGGTVFEGENLMELLRSKLLVQKTLLSQVTVDGKPELLVNYYIRINKLDEGWDKRPGLKGFRFTSDQKPGNRLRDSLLKNFSRGIIEGSLVIGKVDKNLNLISIAMTDYDELFAKMFVEQLADNAIQYYIDYKVQKSRQNVAILQRQTDSIRSLLTGNIVSVAVSNDLNVNPVRQVVRANVQRKQVDVQVNSQVYGELLKQLEFSKITLRRETPLIQFIDLPTLPLDKQKMGRFKGMMLFGIVGASLAIFILLLRRMFSTSPGR
ncbi:lipopolysaccharide biosynthesis protein [Segetibacter sp. 3557_3]|uniref:lipopolysaccharide biosynthesis protein n=1 Tax=Segetibacter sp. 3557_3 TaxID=2547429 RepID=UPI0010585DE5|nr:lipopolysaccharide biosynthesis protein [Segetibacter sp. 3557_3]TDH23320.1 lipopolysaccharide biosynthesis protein [Segetibacter sp. 3557_3]